MKNVFKNPLKIITVGLFIMAMGFGMFANATLNEYSGDVDLFALNSSFPSGEESGEWEEVIYTTYPKSITCKGDGPLECKWP